MGVARLAEFGVVLFVAILFAVPFFALAIWEFVHNKLRKEKKEDVR